MKLQDRFNQAFSYFKESYDYKMGGTQTVLLPNGKEKYFDDRQYYSGRGSKYNNNIKHDIKGLVQVSRKQYSEFLQLLKDREISRENARLELEAKNQRLKEAQQKGIYTFVLSDDPDRVSGHVELSTEETQGQFFDVKRLAKTFDVCDKEISNLRSGGKTYLFVRQISTGKLIEFYHAHLDPNNLNIWFEYVTDDYYRDFVKKWNSSLFGKMYPEKEDEVHFVC